MKRWKTTVNPLTKRCFSQLPHAGVIRCRSEHAYSSNRRYGVGSSLPMKKSRLGMTIEAKLKNRFCPALTRKL